VIDVELEEDLAAFEARDPQGKGYVDQEQLRHALVQVNDPEGAYVLVGLLRCMCVHRGTGGR
jgi:hypothetical protein